MAVFFSYKNKNIFMKISIFKGKIYAEVIQPKIISPLKNKNPYDEISEDSEEDKIEEIEQTHKKTAPSKNRTSVSAEAYGVFNKKSVFKPKLIKKTADQIQRIKEKISQSFLFAELDSKDFETVINAFEEKNYK